MPESEIKISLHFNYNLDKNMIGEKCEPRLTIIGSNGSFDAVLSDVEMDRLLEGIYPILNLLQNRINEIKGGK